MKIVLNQKCNFTKSEFLSYQEKLSTLNTSHDLILCPSTCYLPLFEIPEISLGAQDVGINEFGSYTGDVIAKQLKSLGVSYCIVGHSERRKYHGENNAVIAEKIKKLLQVKIVPILCIGETKEERLQGKVLDKIQKDLEVLDSLTESEKEEIIIAYEPIWAIGTGNIPSVLEIDSALSMIKKICPNSTVLYGGSVSEENIRELKASQYIEGYLLGGISLNPEKLQELFNNCK